LLRIAVLIPCFNEEATVGSVIEGFRDQLPDAEVYVYDNNSTDNTAEVARSKGVHVRHEPRPGKGNVVRRMFADIEADAYVLVDGDDTYDPRAAPSMVTKLVGESLDMVVATRLDTATGEEAFRAGHQFGNKVITRLVGLLFGRALTDILSGYRVFSRRFVKSFPVRTAGFEIETEMTVHALHLKAAVAEIPAPYGSRPSGSESKLSTYGDGFRILWMIIYFLKEVRPLLFFSTLAALFAASSLWLFVPILQTFLETSLVPRFPTAILSTGLMLAGFLSFLAGLILDSVASARWEEKRRAYQSFPAPSSGSPGP
jgi:glycosyltransferase involved in cell wall biosynthesis